MTSSEDKNQKEDFPVLPLRDIVVFPHMIVPLFVGREKSVRALEDVLGERERAVRQRRDARRRRQHGARPARGEGVRQPERPPHLHGGHTRRHLPVNWIGYKRFLRLLRRCGWFWARKIMPFPQQK